MCLVSRQDIRKDYFQWRVKLQPGQYGLARSLWHSCPVSQWYARFQTWVSQMYPPISLREWLWSSQNDFEAAAKPLIWGGWNGLDFTNTTITLLQVIPAAIIITTQNDAITQWISAWQDLIHHAGNSRKCMIWHWGANHWSWSAAGSFPMASQMNTFCSFITNVWARIDMLLLKSHQ